MSTLPPSASEDRAPKPAPAAAIPTVLVVDDYAENRRLLYFYLRERYEVVTCASAEEALDYLAEHDVALVVMDINLKDGMNGIEAAERIRADEQTRVLPILAISAYAYPDDRARFLRAGFDDYIAKPIFKDQMLKKVASLLAGERRGVRAAEGGE